MRLLALLCAVLLLLVLLGCGGGAGPAQPAVTGVDALLSEATAKLGVAGGTVTAPNGASLTVPAGGLPGDRPVTIRHLARPAQTNAPDGIAVDVTGAAGATGTWAVAVPAPAGFTQAEVCGLLLDLDGTAVVPTTTVLDDTARTLTATVDLTGRGARGLCDRIRFLFALEARYTPLHTSVLIRTPYYEQVGGSCWAADAKMLMRAMSATPRTASIGDILRRLQVADHDWGGNLGTFTGSLPSYLATETRSGVEWRGYHSTDHLKWRILRELDAGRPLILRHPGIGWGHALLIVGYMGSGHNLIVHDSKGIYPASSTEGGMYCVRSWSWLEGKMGNTTTLQVVWLVTAPPSATLQTLGLPSTNESNGPEVGRLSFEQDTGTSTFGCLQYMPSQPKGYQWCDYSGTVVDAISSQATRLVCEAPVWNAAARAATVTVRLQVRDGTSAGTMLAFRESDPIALPSVDELSDTGKPAHMVTLAIPLSEVRDPQLAANGKQPIVIHGSLLDAAGTELDAWVVDAELSLGPEVRTISPATQEVGEDVTIAGAGFGAHSGGALPGVLQVAGQPMAASDVVNWTDTSITFHVPWSAPSTCNVTVTVGGLTSNGKTFAATIRPCPAGDYELRTFPVEDPKGGTLSMGRFGSLSMAVNGDGSATIGPWGFPITTVYGSGTIAPNNSRPNWNDSPYTYTGFDCVVPVLWPSDQPNHYGRFEVRYAGSFTGTAVRPDGSRFALPTISAVAIKQ